MRSGRFVRDTLGVAASQYVARAVVLARGLAAAATLGPGGYGGWNALNLILDYGSYAACGAFQGLDLELPAAVAHGRAEEARRRMAGAWSAAAAGGALFAAGLIAYLASGGRAFSAWPGVGLPLLMLVAALMQLAFQYLASALRAHERFGAVSAGTTLQAVLGAGLGLALVARFGPWGLVGGWLAGTVVALIAMKRAIPEAPLTPAHLRDGIPLVRAGLPLFAYFASTLVLRSADRIALVHYGAPSSLGLYSLGLMTSGLVLYVPEAASYVLFPRIAAARGARDRERTRVETVRTHRAVTLVVPLTAGLGVLFAGPLVARVLPAYAGAMPAIRWLAIAATFLTAATVPGYYLLASGRHRRLLAVGIPGTAAAAALVFAVAARAPDAGAVALAAALGQGLFSLGVLLLGSFEWAPTVAGRARLVLVSLLPALVAGAIATLVCRWGSDGSLGVACLRAAAYLVVCAPLLAVFGRGVGIRTMVREWFAARSGPAG